MEHLVHLCYSSNCFSSIIYFGQISYKVQKGCNSKKKKRIKLSCRYAHLHIMSFITTKFQEILLSGFRGVAPTVSVVSFILAKFLSSKRA